MPASARDLLQQRGLAGAGDRQGVRRAVTAAGVRGGADQEFRLEASRSVAVRNGVSEFRLEASREAANRERRARTYVGSCIGLGGTHTKGSLTKPLRIF